MKRRDFAAALLAGALPAVRAATPGVDAPPEPGPPPPILLPPFESFELGNGVRVVAATRAQVPLVTLSAVALGGREHDPPDRAGLATLTATLLTKGARRGGAEVDATALAAQAEALGGSLDGAAGWRSLAVGMTVTRPRVADALALVADVVRAPRLQAEELERSRAQSIDALRVSLGEPGAVAAMVARRLRWGDTPYGRVVTEASLRRIATDDVRAFHGRVVRPDRLLLLLSGDVDAGAARELAERAFGDWRRPSEPAPTVPASEARPLAPRVVWIDMPGSGQSGVAVAAPYVALDDADRHAAEVANALLGGGYSSRLNQEVRIRRGLSYGAFSAAESSAADGAWFGQAQTRHDRAAEVALLIREELLRAARESAAVAELDARKATLIGGFASRLDTTAGVAAVLGQQLAFGRPLDELRRRVDDVAAVTPQRVRAVAERLWDPQRTQVVVAGDFAAAGASTARLGPDLLRLPVAELEPERADLRRR